MWFRFLAFPLALLAGLAVAAVLAVALVLAVAYPNLPALQALTEYQPKLPLRIYSAEGVLIGEFGEERRSVVSIEEVPDALKHAILAAEDERFYEHPGIDYVGVLRAAYANLVAGGRRQGASTITMQRSEEHTSELQSRLHLVCRLLLEKKKTQLVVDHL